MWVFLVVNLGFMFSSWTGYGLFMYERQDVLGYYASGGCGAHFEGLCGFCGCPVFAFCVEVVKCWKVEVSEFYLFSRIVQVVRGESLG
ncbi:hypothetical protein BGZ60DRAFT_192411 [Tricladium varicosporioides]|nr:hypothetical protein BGZ60DRAFT_192411 [Hymenoscyphus varicosporioides]